MGVERWFDRKHSHLRGRVKYHLDRSHFSVGAAVTRTRIEARGRIAASSAVSCAMGALGLVRVSNTEEGTSSAFFTLTRKCGAFPRVFSAGRKGFGGLRFCFLHIKQIVASSVRHDHVRRIPVEKRRGVNAVRAHSRRLPRCVVGGS